MYPSLNSEEYMYSSSSDMNGYIFGMLSQALPLLALKSIEAFIAIKSPSNDYGRIEE